MCAWGGLSLHDNELTLNYVLRRVITTVTVYSEQLHRIITLNKEQVASLGLVDYITTIKHKNKGAEKVQE